MSKKLNKPKLAELSGISRSQVFLIEKTGHTSEDTAWKLADTLGVSLEDLLPDNSGGVSREGVLMEQQSPLDPENPSTKLFFLSAQKIKKAALSRGEEIQLRGVLERAINIFTIEDPETRRRWTNVLVGAVELYHDAVFPEGGGMSLKSSNLEEEQKGQA